LNLFPGGEFLLFFLFPGMTYYNAYTVVAILTFPFTLVVAIQVATLPITILIPIDG